MLIDTVEFNRLKLYSVEFCAHHNPYTVASYIMMIVTPIMTFVNALIK